MVPSRQFGRVHDDFPVSACGRPGMVSAGKPRYGPQRPNVSVFCDSARNCNLPFSLICVFLMIDRMSHAEGIGVATAEVVRTILERKPIRRWATAPVFPFWGNRLRRKLLILLG